MNFQYKAYKSGTPPDELHGNLKDAAYEEYDGSSNVIIETLMSLKSGVSIQGLAGDSRIQVRWYHE